MCKKLLVYFSLFFLPFFCFSQEQGYKISVSIAEIKDQMLYITGNYGEESYVFDSVKVKKGSFTLQHKQRGLPSGIYQIRNKKGEIYFDFIVDRSRHFSITTSLDYLNRDFFVDNSDENQLYYLFKKEFQHEMPSNSYIDNLLETSPDALLSKYINARYSEPEMPVFLMDDNFTADVHAEYHYLIEHFFDNVDFTDARLLRVPLDLKVDLFFTQLLIQNPDTINCEIDHFIALMGDNEEVKHHYLRYLYHLFDDGNPLHDAILVHLYDIYCHDHRCDWLEESLSRRLYRDVMRKRNTLPGHIVPHLEAFDRDGKLFSTKEIKNSYFFLWFWDPDCEDCLELTPVLYEFYDTFSELYDFEVVAISITEDLDRWINFVDENGFDWVNLSYATGEPNYDLIDYFDLITTPGIFLLSRDHKIIARQFSLDELIEQFNH